MNPGFVGWCRIGFGGWLKPMKEAGSRRSLARTPVADVWRHTLSQIPSVFGRLVYLASLRDSNTGEYEHHGLIARFGAEAAGRALRESHEQTFAEWINLTIEEQTADLDLYFSAQKADRRTIIESWLTMTPYTGFAPGATREVERQLYLADLEAILELLKNEYGASLPDPDA